MKNISFQFNSSAFKHLPTYFSRKYFLCNRASVWRGIFVVQFFILSNAYQHFFTQIFFYVSSITLGSWNRGWSCCSDAFRETLRRTMQIAECSWLQGGGPRQSLLLAKDPDQFLKTLYTIRVCAQTCLPKFPETSLNKGKERYNQI